MHGRYILSVNYGLFVLPKGCDRATLEMNDPQKTFKTVKMIKIKIREVVHFPETEFLSNVSTPVMYGKIIKSETDKKWNRKIKSETDGILSPESHSQQENHIKFEYLNIFHDYFSYTSIYLCKIMNKLLSLIRIDFSIVEIKNEQEGTE